MPGELFPCSRCERALPREAFHRESRRPNGLQLYCKACKREHNAERWQDYKHTPEAKAAHKRARIRYEERHPLKAAAHAAVKKAIRTGVLPPPRFCERWTQGAHATHDCAGPVEYHHDDYNEPLKVRPLCKVHHERWHHDHDAPADPIHLEVAA